MDGFCKSLEMVERDRVRVRIRVRVRVFRDNT